MKMFSLLLSVVLVISAQDKEARYITQGAGTIKAAPGLDLAETKALVAALQHLQKPRMDVLAAEIASGKVKVEKTLSISFDQSKLDDTVGSFAEIVVGLLDKEKTVLVSPGFFQRDSCGRFFELSVYDVFVDFIEQVKKSPEEWTVLQEYSSDDATQKDVSASEIVKLEKLIDHFGEVVKKHLDDLPALIAQCPSISQELNVKAPPKNKNETDIYIRDMKIGVDEFTKQLKNKLHE